MSVLILESIIAGYISLPERYCLDRSETLYSSQLKLDYPLVDFSSSKYWLFDEISEHYFPIESDRDLKIKLKPNLALSTVNNC